MGKEGAKLSDQQEIPNHKTADVLNELNKLILETNSPQLCDDCKRHIKRAIGFRKGLAGNCLAYGCHGNGNCDRDRIVEYILDLIMPFPELPKPSKEIN